MGYVAVATWSGSQRRFHRVALTDLPGLPLTDLAPVAARKSKSGRLHASALKRDLPSRPFLASLLGHVDVGSGLEAQLLAELDRAGDVELVLPQPLSLGLGAQTYTPDFLVVAAGRVTVWEAHLADQIGEAKAAKYAAAATELAKSGWAFAVHAGFSRARAKNLEYLTCSRRRPASYPDLAPLLLAAVADLGSDANVGSLLARTSEHMLSRAVLWHLLWCRQIQFDEELPLSNQTLLALPPSHQEEAR